MKADTIKIYYLHFEDDEKAPHGVMSGGCRVYNHYIGNYHPAMTPNEGYKLATTIAQEGIWLIDGSVFISPAAIMAAKVVTSES